MTDIELITKASRFDMILKTTEARNLTGAIFGFTSPNFENLAEQMLKASKSPYGVRMLFANFNAKQSTLLVTYIKSL